MATTALGIMQTSDGAGVDPLTHRRIIQARWANPGVISGLSVTGGSGLTYGVAAGNAVLSRSASDGYTEAYWEGGQTPAVSAGDPSNPRIDTIWLKACDAQQGDPDNRVHVGVTQGTPSSSPVAPSAPSGCLAVARMLVPAGATSTAGAQQTSAREFAVPFGASLGLLGEYHDTADAEETLSAYQTAIRYQVQVTLPTDRLVELETVCCAFSSGKGGAISDSFLYLSFAMDGQYLANAGGETRLDTLCAQTVRRSHVVAATRGTHSFGAVYSYSNSRPHYRYGAYSDGGSRDRSFPGRIFRVWDRGVSE